MEGGEIPSLCAGLHIFIKKDGRQEKVEKLNEVSCKNFILKEIYLLTYLLTYLLRLLWEEENEKPFTGFFF